MSIGRDDVLRVAMWSGPRNISTALMRSFENRPDCVVVDEPFYACYLKQTGLDHPGRDLVLESQSADAGDILQTMMAPLARGITVQYQKHMGHHLLPDMPTGWLKDVTSCFLLRDPRAMIASYVKTRPDIALRDLGIIQLADVFERVADHIGRPPLVIDSDDLLAAPEQMLRLLCARIGIGFTENMLAWPAGPRDTDGAWAPWWYRNVEKSTGFEKRHPFAGTLPPDLEEIAVQAMHVQDRLARYKIDWRDPLQGQG